MLAALALAEVARAGEPPPGSSLAPNYFFETAVYHLPLPRTDPKKLLTRLVAKQQGLLLDRDPKAPPSRPSVAVRIVDARDYGPPGADTIEHFGRGLSKAQEKQLAGSRQVTILNFGGPRPQALASYRQGLALTAALAREAGGFLWDEQARLVFTPEAWAEREQHWSADGLPNVANHVMIHAYRHGELLRMVSLGMSKFGQADVVVNQVATSDTAMGSVITLLCQRLVEGETVQKGGRFNLAIDQIRHPFVRDNIQLKPNARKRATLLLADGKREEGDADNDLVEIIFPGPPARLQERHNALLVELFGSDEDGIVGANHHDKALMAASARAKARAIALKPRYAKSPPVNERLLVKTPFDTASGNHEYMWVEVVRWDGKRIDGILQNDPDNVPGLKAGARVVVDETDVFDYVLFKPDGSQEGNETGAILMKRQK